MSQVKTPENTETIQIETEPNVVKKPKAKATEAKNTQKSEIKADEPKEYKVKKTLDPNMYITVKNGYQGTLIYKSKRTSERFEWDGFGAEQEMSLQELKNAKGASKDFFANNWFLINDPEIIEYLGVGQYYKNALDYDSFDDLFSKTPDEIKNAISMLSKGQKQSVAYRSKQLINDKVIDSIRVIEALEQSLSIELIER